MAKKKEINKKTYRFYTICPYCGNKHKSDNLDDMPSNCCGFDLVINDRENLVSRYKEELEG